MKEILLLIIIIGTMFHFTPKGNLQLALGNYTLEPIQNSIVYEPSNRGAMKDFAEEITKQFFIDPILGDLTSNTTEQSNWIVIEKGEKPPFQTDVKLNDQETLEFENYINLFYMQYGKIKLGQNNKNLQIAFPQGYGYVSKIFIDLNYDGKITSEEKFSTKEVSLVTYYQKDNKGQKNIDYYVYKSRIDNVPIMVDYIKSNHQLISKEIHVSFYIERSQKPTHSGMVKNKLSYEVKDYFSGICSVIDKGQPKNVKFIIVDSNNNGVFNDFNIDSIFIDTGKNTLTEYKLQKTYENSGSKKITVNLFSYPKCLLITGENDESSTSEEIEP